MFEKLFHQKLTSNDRYFMSFINLFILGLIVFSSRELDPWIKNFVPAYVVYITGNVLVAQIQQMIGQREVLRCEANEEDFKGIDPRKFRFIILSHVMLFCLFVLIPFYFHFKDIWSLS